MTRSLYSSIIAKKEGSVWMNAAIVAIRCAEIMVTKSSERVTSNLSGISTDSKSHPCGSRFIGAVIQCSAPSSLSKRLMKSTAFIGAPPLVSLCGDTKYTRLPDLLL